jgi:hypothetical protein
VYSYPNDIFVLVPDQPPQPNEQQLKLDFHAAVGSLEEK